MMESGQVSNHRQLDRSKKFIRQGDKLTRPIPRGDRLTKFLPPSAICKDVQEIDTKILDLVPEDSADLPSPGSKSVCTSDILDVVIPAELTPHQVAGAVASKASSEPGRPAVAHRVSERLDLALRRASVNECGLSPRRSAIYLDLMGEVVRQTGVACAERALLLARCRDEMSSSVERYWRLLNSLYRQPAERLTAQYKQFMLLCQRDERLDSDIQAMHKEVEELRVKLLTLKVDVRRRREVCRERREQEERVLVARRDMMLRELHSLLDPSSWTISS